MALKGVPAMIQNQNKHLAISSRSTGSEQGEDYFVVQTHLLRNDPQFLLFYLKTACRSTKRN